MKRLLSFILPALFLIPFPAFAEIKTITHTVQQPFGGSQSPDDARTAGIARAKREALEQFGTYIESVTIVKDSRVDSDEILALTAGITKAEVLNRGVAYSMLNQLERGIKDFDQAILLNPNYLGAFANRGTAYAALNQFERAIADYDKVILLDTNIAGIYLERGVAYAALNQFDRAITDFDRTIRLEPNDALAYNNRGSAYIELYQFYFKDVIM